MRRLLPRGERGFALVLALGVMVVFSMTVITVIEAATGNSRTAVQSRNRMSAFGLAEAGINNAASIARKVPSPYDPHALHPQAPNQPADCANPPANPANAALLGNTCSPFVSTYDGGSATYSGVFDTSTNNWTVTSTGSVRNPYGGQPTTRTLVAVIHIRAAASQTNVVPAWNYVFVRDTTPNICNVTLDQSTSLTASLYTEGNLCFKNAAGITEPNPADPVLLEVRGKLVWLSGASKGVGDPTSGQVTSAKIGGGCGSSVTGTTHTCSSSSPTNDYFYVKAGGYSALAPAIIAPTLTTADWDSYYQNSTISRITPCASGGLPGSSFDNDTVRNSSLITTFNITAGSSYTCQTKNASGSVIGELDWDASTHVLSIRGTVFIDGNVSISGVVKYRGLNYQGQHPSGSNGSDGTGGQMVMYISGTATFSNNGVFCGWDSVNDRTAYNGSTCDFDAWTPASSMFMFIAGGGVTLGQGSYFQGAIFTPGAVSVGQSSQTEGPVIAGTMSIGQSAQMKPLPGLADLPLGAPGNPNTSGVPEAPAYSSG